MSSRASFTRIIRICQCPPSRQLSHRLPQGRYDLPRLLFYSKATRLEPPSDRGNLFSWQTKPFAEFLHRDPVVEYRRAALVELMGDLFEQLLLPSRASQQEHYVLHREVVGNLAHVVRCVRFGTRVTLEREGAIFVNLLRGQCR